MQYYLQNLPSSFIVTGAHKLLESVANGNGGAGGWMVLCDDDSILVEMGVNGSGGTVELIDSLLVVDNCINWTVGNIGSWQHLGSIAGVLEIVSGGTSSSSGWIKSKEMPSRLRWQKQMNNILQSLFQPKDRKPE